MDLSNFNKSKTVRRKLDNAQLMFGKVPPQAKELEDAILGAIMLEKGAFDTVAEILKPECFYLDANQRIFKAMQGLAIKSLPIAECHFHKQDVAHQYQGYRTKDYYLEKDLQLKSHSINI